MNSLVLGDSPTIPAEKSCPRARHAAASASRGAWSFTCVPLARQPIGDHKRALNRHRRESTAIASDLLAQAHSCSDDPEPTGTRVRGRPVEPCHQPEAALARVLEIGRLLGTVLRRDWLKPATYPVGATGSGQLVDWNGDIVWEFDLEITGERVFHQGVSSTPPSSIPHLMSRIHDGRAPVDGLGRRPPDWECDSVAQTTSCSPGGMMSIGWPTD